MLLKRNKNLLLLYCVSIFFILFNIVGCGADQAIPDDAGDATVEDEETSGPVEVKTMQLGHVLSPTSHYQFAAEEFARLVEEGTNGSVIVEIFPSSQIGDERELVEGMNSGFIDASIVSTGLYGGFVPELNMLDIPFLFSDLDHVKRVLGGEIGQQFMDMIASTTNITPLSFMENGFRQMTNNVRPLKEPEDFRDLKIRNPAWPTHVAALEVLGANPLIVDFADLYMALERNSVDGQHNAIALIESSGFQEVQDYMSILDWSYGASLLSMSNDMWDKLNEVEQQVVLQAAIDAYDYQVKVIREMEEPLIEILAEDMEITYKEEVNAKAFQDILEAEAYPVFIEEYGSLLEQIIEAR